ncbi:MAG: hypothetical protein ABTQ31_12800 [Rhizobiaceae bacterium]
MPWVRFTADFDFKPKPLVTIAYRAGHVLNVTSDCAAKAIAAGKAVRMKKSGKSAEPVEVDDDDGRAA